MPVTYENIATTTLSSSGTDITFSSIGSGFTDLRLVINLTPTASSFVRVQFNGDTANNYSLTRLHGNGTTATSNRNSSISGISFIASSTYSTTIPTFLTADVFSYAGSTNKTVLATLSGDYNGSGEVSRIVGLWRNTAAITSLRLYLLSGDFAAGTTATLYGILRA